MTVLVEAVNTPAAWSERAASAATSWEAAGWTEDGQRARFDVVLWALDPQPGELLVDFGCGTGALADRLPSTVGYVGFDTAPGMVARARAEHPGRLFTSAEPGHADLVACVGTFNLPGGKLETWATLRRLWDGTRRALAVSLYAGDDDRCLVYTEDEARRFGASESYFHQVTSWRSNDLLLVLSRKALW